MTIATILLAATTATAIVDPTALCLVEDTNSPIRSVSMVGDGYVYIQYADWTNLLGRVDALEAPIRRLKEARARNEATRNATVERLKEAAKVHALARRHAIEQRQKYLKEKGIKK